MRRTILVVAHDSTGSRVLLKRYSASRSKRSTLGPVMAGLVPAIPIIFAGIETRGTSPRVTPVGWHSLWINFTETQANAW